MAHTAAGRKLTETHRKDQNTLAASLVDILKDIFLDVFRTDDIDGSSREFIRKALPIVLKARKLSNELATAYLDAFRRVEIRGLVDHSELRGDLADPLTVDPKVLKMWVDLDMVSEDALDSLPGAAQVAAALHSSGAAVAKGRIGRGESPEDAAQTAARAVAAKGVKLVMDGGRAPLEAEVRNRRHGAVGYARVVDADPCPFCAMLASRGAIYRSDSFDASNSLFTGDNRFKVHDGCGCTLEPIYGRRLTDLPPGSAELVKQWAEVASGQPDPFGAWRRWKASGTRPGEERAGVDTSTVVPSAPQYGRARRRASGKSRRKSIDELDRDTLSKALRGMYVRRSGMEAQLAGLENAGQSIHEPGPANAIHAKLQRLERQISHAQSRLSTLTK